MNDEQIIKKLIKILDSVSTYKSGNTVYLSDGSSFELPQKTVVKLINSNKSYR